MIIKTCANCKYFRVVKQGYEIKNLLDSAYLISKCKKKGWKVKEFYLAPNTLKKEYSENEECEFWEENISFWNRLKMNK